jgi:hypothetical protein
MRKNIFICFLFLLLSVYMHAMQDASGIAAIIKKDLSIPTCLEKTIEYYAENFDMPEKQKIKCTSKEISTVLNIPSDTLGNDSRLFRHTFVKQIPSLFGPNRIIKIIEKTEHEAMVLMLVQALWNEKRKDITFKPDKIDTYTQTPLFFGLFKLFQFKELDGIEEITAETKTKLKEYFTLSHNESVVKGYVERYIKNESKLLILWFPLIHAFENETETIDIAQKISADDFFVILSDPKKLFVSLNETSQLLLTNFKRFLLLYLFTFQISIRDAIVKELTKIAINNKDSHLLQLVAYHLFKTEIAYTYREEEFADFIAIGQRSETHQETFEAIITLLSLLNNSDLEHIANQIIDGNMYELFELTTLKQFIFRRKLYSMLPKILKVGALLSAILGIGAITNLILKKLQIRPF